MRDNYTSCMIIPFHLSISLCTSCISLLCQIGSCLSLGVMKYGCLFEVITVMHGWEDYFWWCGHTGFSFSQSLSISAALYVDISQIVSCLVFFFIILYVDVNQIVSCLAFFFIILYVDINQIVSCLAFFFIILCVDINQIVHVLPSFSSFCM